MQDADWSSWMNFYVAGAGAAAALAGLVFVALSINLERALAIPGMAARGGEAIVLLAVALLSSLLALIPGQSLSSFGWELIPVALLAWLVPLLIQWRAVRKRHFRESWHVLLRLSLQQAATLPILVAAVMLIEQHGSARYGVALGILASLITGMIAAWILLVEIVR